MGKRVEVKTRANTPQQIEHINDLIKSYNAINERVIWRRKKRKAEVGHIYRFALSSLLFRLDERVHNHHVYYPELYI